MTKVLEIIGKRPQGGIGSFITNYQSNFPGKEVILDYLIFSDEPSGLFDKKVKKMGSRVYVLPELKNTRLFRIWKSIYDFFEKYGEEYDAVHLHSANIGFMVFPVAKKCGINNLIVHSHSTMYSDNKINAFRNYFLCLGIQKHASHYLACSIASADFLFGKKNRNRVLIFNNAIECDRFAFKNEIRTKYREQMGVEGKFVIGHVGMFYPVKNQSMVVDIFKSVCEKISNAVLILVGEGPLKKEVEDKVAEYGLNHKVLFLGQRYDVNNTMMAMDVFVLPSVFEGIPVVGIEAQASGLPCFISDAISNEISLQDVEFLSINDTPKEWAEIIIKKGRNDNIKREMAYRDISRKGYDIKTEATKLYEFYMSL
ncbi:MAG: glycosyltransferase family 1 protein [Lachnospiraceae bacterium]|nr:glycosyltransferase family 1 protein [Lachnospiraceae bacterium]